MEMEKLIDQRLSASPKAFPIAPESANLPIEIRHLVSSRYRVLFNVGKADVYILRITGPFSGQALDLDSPDAS